MSTANFRTQEDFPLLVKGDVWIKLCGECGCANADDAGVCAACGCSLDDVPPRYDEWEMEDWRRNFHDVLDALNAQLRFFRVVTMPGYYTGIQLYVERTDEDDPNDLDNADAHFLYDCCRSKAIRMFEREKDRVIRNMRKMVDSCGMTELRCVARFSNGEAMYEEAPKKLTRQMPVRTLKTGVA